MALLFLSVFSRSLNSDHGHVAHLLRNEHDEWLRHGYDGLVLGPVHDVRRARLARLLSVPRRVHVRQDAAVWLVQRCRRPFVHGRNSRAAAHRNVPE